MNFYQICGIIGFCCGIISLYLNYSLNKCHKKTIELMKKDYLDLSQRKKEQFELMKKQGEKIKKLTQDLIPLSKEGFFE